MDDEIHTHLFTVYASKKNIVATVPSIPDLSRAHTRIYIYILSYLISVSFFFFVDCSVRVRVSSRVGLGTVLVSFFIAFFLSDVC